MTALSKGLGRMDMVVDRLQFRNHVALCCKLNCNPDDQNEFCEVSVCLSVCPTLYRYRLAFLGRMVGDSHVIVKETV